MNTELQPFAHKTCFWFVNHEQDHWYWYEALRADERPDLCHALYAYFRSAVLCFTNNFLFMYDRCRTLMWLQQLWKLHVLIFSFFQNGKESMKVCISVCILHYIGNTYQLSKVGVLRYCLTSSETSKELEKVNQGQFFYFFFLRKKICNCLLHPCKWQECHLIWRNFSLTCSHSSRVLRRVLLW